MRGHQDKRHLARKLALATSYCQQKKSGNFDECLNISIENLELKEGEWDADLTKAIINGIVLREKEINDVIRENAPQWPLDKIFKIDLVIMQMAIFELLFNSDAKTMVPEKVAIDEAIELAKEFGNETSSKFVNGVLGTVLENKEKNVSKENTKDNS